jgi:hypothetical protein
MYTWLLYETKNMPSRRYTCLDWNEGHNILVNCDVAEQMGNRRLIILNLRIIITLTTCYKADTTHN